MKEINSVDNALIKKLFKLKNDKNLVIESGEVLVEGKNIIIEQNKKNRISLLLVKDERLFQDIENRILVSEKIIKKLSSRVSNIGAIGVLDLKKIKSNPNSENVVVLEGISNPNNLGSICRTSLAFGYNTILTLGDTVFPYNQKVISSSQGLVFDVNIKSINYETLKKFNCYSFKISKNSKSLIETKFKTPFALIFGNESRGLTKKTNLSNINNIYIPMKRKVDSLNLSNAVSIAVYYTSKLDNQN